MDFNQLPNFFIIGAAKSGTTSLFEIIAQHPQVYVSREKECRFFSNDERFNRGLDWYQDVQFPGAAGIPVRAEASPAYLTWSQKVAPRIKELYDGRPIRFAAIFRDPVKRAYSQYWHRVRLGDEDPSRLSFAEAIHTEQQRLDQNWSRLEAQGNGLYGYFRAGCYASRLQPFLDAYPRENFFFMLQEDLYKDFDASMARLLRFLEIDDTVRLKAVISNESAIPRSRGLYNIFNSFKKTSWKDRLKPFIPANLRRWFRYDAIMKPFSYPPMEDSIRRELYALYDDEITRLEAIIHRDLSHWRGR